MKKVQNNGEGENMRLWHEDLIPLLPTQQLLGQHREICALRGLSWKKPHSVVNYVFEHPYQNLFAFHVIVMNEMERRGYSINPLWKDPCYRGQRIGVEISELTMGDIHDLEHPIYQEHDQFYYQECIDNLKSKGVYVDY